MRTILTEPKTVIARYIKRFMKAGQGPRIAKRHAMIMCKAKGYWNETDPR